MFFDLNSSALDSRKRYSVCGENMFGLIVLKDKRVAPQTFDQQAHTHHLSAETATAAITLADWYAAQQLDILRGGRWQAKRDRENEVLKLLADNPTGITARDVYRRNIAKSPEEARDLLATMEGQLTGKDITPEHGGKKSRIYTLKQGR